MIKMIDPTYIRTIYDGLNSGLLHKDNNSDLPLGLFGMYEDAISSVISVNERKRFLDFFTVWALLKKEVSLEFILPLLEGWAEDQIKDYIEKYSKWFNSPVPSKFLLYHERLRIFLLQKISDKQFTVCNDIIIKQCQKALQLQNGSEWERYALEHLSKHMLIPAFEHGNSDPFKKVAYDTKHWSRQIEISKGFEWSRQMLNEMMLWASKYSEDEVIECALNKVDLHHQEQNDAPRIIELVANNDIETALQRIESFGGNDKEGLQRKFILYMLCLMELTLLESNDKPFSKEAIEKLIKHLDDNLPVDHSLLNWNDFFPSYLIFKMACVWAEMGLEYILVYKRTLNWDSDWIEALSDSSDSILKVLENLISIIKDEGLKKEIGDKFYKNSNDNKKIKVDKIPTIKKVDEEFSLNIRNDTIFFLQNEIDNTYDPYDKAKKLINLGYQILKLGSNGNIDSIIYDVLDSINKIDDGEDAILKCYAYSDSSGLLFKSGKIKESYELLNNAISIFPLINIFDRLEAIECVGRECVLECKFDLLGLVNSHALELAHQLDDDWFDYSAISEEGMIESVLYELRLKGNYKLIEEIILKQNVLNQLKNLNIFVYKWLILSDKFYKLKLIFINSLKYNKILDQDYHLYKIALYFISKSNIEKAMLIATNLSDPSKKTSIYVKIAIEKIAKENENLIDELALKINLNDEKFAFYESVILNLISIDIEVENIIKYISKLEKLILNKFNNDSFLIQIISLYLKINEPIISLDYSYKIWDDDERNLTQIRIAVKLAQLSRIEDALACVNNLSDNYWKFSALRDISAELANQGKKQISDELLIKSFEYASGASDYFKIAAIQGVAIELVKLGRVEEALNSVELINDESNKNYSFKSISIELAMQGKLEKAFDIAISIIGYNYEAIKIISLEYLKRNELVKAIEIIKSITNEYIKNEILCEISFELAKLDKIEMAIENANFIESEYSKSEALQGICKELVKKKKFNEAEYVSNFITQSNKRYECWKLIAINLFESKGLLCSLISIKKFSSVESINHIKGVIINSIYVTNTEFKIALNSLKEPNLAISSIEHILRMYILNQLFFASTTVEKMDRFNQSLNIQWAIDIKNELLN
jgi:hypothetical protein